jgi:subtilisin-like proprotein convertase family protein
LNIPDYILVGDVNVVDLSGTHDRMGDLLFSLTSPEGTSVGLFGPVCGGDADFDLNLDNEALVADIPCPPTDQGTYQPSGSLADLGGQVAQGDWELLIKDLYNGNAGRLSTWGLEVCRLALSIGDATASESAGSMDFTVSMNGLSATDVTVHYTTISGTASAGSDFLATTGVLTIPAGSVSGVISVPIVNDSDVEGCETFELVLSNVTGALLEDNQATLSATGSIEDDDGAGGQDPTLAWTLDGSGSEWFGFSLANGDFNGDGVSDIAVGAQAASGWDGRVRLFYGPDLAATSTLSAVTAGENFGHAVASADVNGDGYDDLIVGAHFYANGETSEGAAYVFHGSASGISTTPDWQYESGQPSALFGYSVAGAGDVNGDGYEDVIIGAMNYRNGFEFNEGGAFVFHGSASGLSAAPDWSVEGGMFIAWLGASVASAGDVNGDGFGDVVIGAPGYNFFMGAAFVYHGSALGLDGTPAQSYIGAIPGEQFGNAVAGAGDVNGDGVDDVIIGGMGYSNDQAREGKAYLYHGSASGLPATPDWTSEGNLDYLMYGYSVSQA